MSAPGFHYCDDLGEHGFGWVAEEAMSRTSHVLAADGTVWLVDPLDWPEAIERTTRLGRPAGVIQLLDRHQRDCAALATRLGVPLHATLDVLPGTPFECIPIVRRKRWQERALWWPETRTLVVADALGTNPFYTGGKVPVGVHLLLRLTPPRQLLSYRAEHLLAGHGQGVHGLSVADDVARAVSESRRRLPGVLVRLPFSARG